MNVILLKYLFVNFFFHCTLTLNVKIICSGIYLKKIEKNYYICQVKTEFAGTEKYINVILSNVSFA